MINIEVTKHDRYTIEFKNGLSITRTDDDIHEFKINTWIFVPNSLHINRSTYQKDQFYKDTKNNIRLITPIYTLGEILIAGKGPLPRLQRAIDKLMFDTTDDVLTENYCYQIKMLMCIMKSSLRREIAHVNGDTPAKELKNTIEIFSASLRTIAKIYRQHWAIISKEPFTKEQREYFLFGDEFFGNILEQYSFKLLRKLKDNPAYSDIKPILVQLVNDENKYKAEKNFMLLDKKDERKNSLIIIQRTILKKFVESDLYLQIVKKKDGAFAFQVYYGMAAAISMAVAAILTFFAARRFGNLTMSLFISTIIVYVFKDRIKDIMRFYFSDVFSKRYFDKKLKLSIRNQEIGEIKDSFDFFDDSKIPDEILSLRNRTPLVEVENKSHREDVILYRKWISLSRKDIEKYKEYKLSGINDIARFNLTSFMHKMDNPLIPLNIIENDEPKSISGVKVYSLVFIVQCLSETEEYYKKYRVLFNRTGITDIKELG